MDKEPVIAAILIANLISLLGLCFIVAGILWFLAERGIL
jgi:hypothetical protein